MIRVTAGRHSHCGQALVETVLLVPLLALMIVAITWFARVLITRQQLLTAARYGIDLIAMTPLSPDDIKQDVRDYLTHRFNTGRRLSPEKLRVEDIAIEIHDFPEISISLADSISSPFHLARILPLMASPEKELSHVSLSYPIEMPSFLSPVAGRTIPVRASAAVLSGTGCRNHDHRRAS